MGRHYAITRFIHSNTVYFRQMVVLLYVRDLHLVSMEAKES
jgi:hypothetical protein